MFKSICRRVGATALAVLALTSSVRSEDSGSAMRAADFIASEGVNTHINYTDGGYANLDTVLRELRFLGTNHVRDGLNAPGQFGSAPLAAYKSLARAGIRFVFFLRPPNPAQPEGSLANPSLAQRVASVAEVARDVPGSVIGVEGPNEINNEPFAYRGAGQSHHGQDELDAALHFQADLYRAVHSDPTLRSVPVAYFTGYAAGGIPVGPDPAITPGLADMDTQHPYPNHGDPPSAWVARSRALGNQSAPSLARRAPAIYTETGYATEEDGKDGVSIEVQAHYLLDLLLDDAKAGIVGTYLYELMDAYPTGSRQGNHGWGLFDNHGQPKRAAVAIRAMNEILADVGSAAHDFAVHPFPYEVAGAGPSGNSLELALSDGRFVVALWDEQPIWNAAARRPLAAEVHKVTVTFGRRGGVISAALFDPMRGSDAIAHYSTAGAISLDVTDHPVFLIVRPATSSGRQ
jgi:hypothetical protein